MSVLLLEHNSFSAGTVYENTLIHGGVGGIINEMILNESNDSVGKKLVKFRGKFQEADAINKNKRSYPYDVLNKNVQALIETIDEGGLVGELDHPTDSIVHFKDASHKVTKLWWEGTTLMGEGVVLDTPAGKVLQSLINNGVRIGISSRGVGNGKVNEEGVLVIGESYKLITFDAVADPSTYSAYQKKIVAKSENYENISTKNENTNIYKLNKDIILACVGGIINKQVNQIKRGLSNE